MKSQLLSLVAVFLFSFGALAQCTITGTAVNASSLTCSSFSGCSVVYIGNGTAATTLTMNADLNLSCLGAIQLVIRNNATLYFTPGNDRLTLAEGSSIIIQSGGTLTGGSCNASERIYIGTNLLASCNGGAGADYSFTDIVNFGGTGSLASNSPVCTGNTINLSATPPPNGTYTYSFLGSGLPGAGTTYSSTPTYSLTAPASAGSYVYQVKMKSSLAGNPVIIAEITVVVNSGLSTATPAATLTQPSCTGTTGTITVTSPTGSGMTYSINGLNYSSSAVFSSVALGTYSVTAKNSSGCISPATNVTIAQPTDTWNGSAWSTGLPPTNSQKIVFAGNYSSASDITGCSCQVTSGNVVFNTGNNLTVVNDVKVTAGSLTFEDGASLVQTNDASVNTGNITYKRKTTPLKQYDYTYWSSPVAAATLSQLATNSLLYSFSPSINNWVYQTGATAMAPGVGYIGRAPNGLAYSPTEVVTTSFIGVPNNGVISTPILKSTGAYNLIGNPYPSAVDADLFITANASSTNGTLYFWTHNTAITNLQYTTNDYAKYNLTGAVRTSTSAISGGALPTGKIAAGQGFFIEAKTSLALGTYSASFNNSMRITSNNTQFFRTAQQSPASVSISEGLERHRIWLSLSNVSGAYSQMLVGYVQGATNGFDSLFDGKTMPVGNPISIYTMVGNDDLSIQGKSLPFSDADIIPVGYNSLNSGEFTIEMDDFDGNFTNQDIYLLDKASNTIHDLKTGPYAFTTAAGTFEDRFELRFTDIQAFLGINPIFSETDVKVVTSSQQLQVVSPAVTITKVEVYDVLGKLLFSQKGLSTKLFQTDSLSLVPQVLLVRIGFDTGQEVVKKTIMQ
ncbi:MAG: hypothetical protein QM710_10365 [Flavobacterium sp.]